MACSSAWIEGGAVGLLHQAQRATGRQRLQAAAAVTAHARQHHAHRRRALVGRQRVEQVVDGVCRAMGRPDRLHLQQARGQPHALARGRHVHLPGGHRLPLRGLLHAQCRVRRQQLGQPAGR
jgi:hypothetical protein